MRSGPRCCALGAAALVAVPPAPPLPAAQVRTVARTFVATAVARRGLVRAWHLAAPALRAGTTEAEWLAGRLPVPRYPVASATATYRAEAVGPRAALVAVIFTPRPGTRAQPTVLALRLVRRGGRWLVASVRGGPRGCRRHGARDPDPGATILWC